MKVLFIIWLVAIIVVFYTGFAFVECIVGDIKFYGDTEIYLFCFFIFLAAGFTGWSEKKIANNEFLRNLMSIID